MLYMLCALVVLIGLFRGDRIGALAGLLHAWWIAPVGVIAPLVALAIVLLAPQMPDMFAGMTDGGSDYGWLHLGRGLGFASGVLGLASWYWTRARLNAEAHGDDRGAPYDPAWPKSVALPLPPFWTWFQTGYRQAPRWAVLPAAVLAGSPLLLAAVGPERASSINATEIAAATVLSLLIFAATVLPFTIGRRANMTLALIPLWLWLGLLLIVPSGGLLWWIGVALVVGLLALAYAGIKRGWVPQHIPAWTWRYPPVGLLFGAPLGWPVGLLIMAAAPVICIITATWPSVVSAMAHAPPVAMIALALIIGPFALALGALRSIAPPYGNWATAPGGVTAKRVFGMGLLGLVVFATPHWLEPNGLYDIRSVLNAELAGDPARRLDLPTALAQWRDDQIACGYPKDAAMPVVIAAAEGGASRAALWFLSAARMLDQQTDRQFGRYLFAISGVSGGSLGAVTYLQALASDRANGGNPCAGPRLDQMEEGFNAMVQADPLAPTLAGYFLNDALLRILPLRMVWHLRDRAAMLESAFEQNWQTWWPPSQAEQARQVATGGLIHLRYNLLTGLAPHLFLNGTDVDSGNRLITSTVRFDAKDDVFPLAEDLLFLVKRDVPAATAVTNSARFPFLSPPGRIPGRQVIDGGYFDNYGSRTADDLVLAIERIAKARGWALVPIVAVISDDADTAEADLPRLAVSCMQPFPASLDTDDTQYTGDTQSNGADTETRHRSLAKREAAATNTPDIDAPVVGLITTRSAHAADGLQILRHRLCGEARLAQIALPAPDPERGEAAPMNWVLNDAAGKLILHRAPMINFNLAQADILRCVIRNAVNSQSRSCLANRRSVASQ